VVRWGERGGFQYGGPLSGDRVLPSSSRELKSCFDKGGQRRKEGKKVGFNKSEGKGGGTTGDCAD